MREENFEVYWCDNCGSYERLGRDACAQWDVVRQDWSLCTVYDEEEICNECGEPGTILWGRYLPEEVLKPGVYYVCSRKENPNVRFPALWSGAQFICRGRHGAQDDYYAAKHYHVDAENGWICPLHELEL